MAQFDLAVRGILNFVTQNPMGLVSGVTQSIVSAVYVFVLNFWLLKDWYKFAALHYRADSHRLSGGDAPAGERTG